MLNLAVDAKAGEVEVSAGATVDGLTFVLDPGDQDGFLARALGGGQVKVPLQLGISWSSRTGLSLLAGAGFGVSLYPHLDLGVVRFDRVDLAVRLAAGPGAPEIGVSALTSFSGAIGPVSYTVDRIGAELRAILADGDAGPFDLDVNPVWPTGLGLAINAGPIRGGGFVALDRAKGRYVGILQVEVFDIGVNAIAMLETRDANGTALPDPGYSFVLLVAADIPHVQLGYGFTLNGVGGIAALNRRLDTTALLAAMRQGGLQRILYPTDPVRDAATIVASLGAIFPVAMGRHVFGPTAIIGWGTPTLITIELAVVVEVPAPVTLTVLGTASVVLPNASAPVVELHVDFVGVVDPGQRTIAVDAMLRDSNVAGFALTGDLAMRLAFGARPAFALAIGGFNPHFAPPPGFPALRRVTVALGADDNPRISLEGYHAITANSRQFGAKAELYAAAYGFNLHGWLSFDALLTLFPLAFRFDFSVGMSLNRGKKRLAGVTVEGTLTGPNPFHVKGSGEPVVALLRHHRALQRHLRIRPRRHRAAPGRPVAGARLRRAAPGELDQRRLARRRGRALGRRRRPAARPGRRGDRTAEGAAARTHPRALRPVRRHRSGHIHHHAGAARQRAGGVRVRLGLLRPRRLRGPDPDRPVEPRLVRADVRGRHGRPRGTRAGGRDKGDHAVVPDKDHRQLVGRAYPAGPGTLDWTPNWPPA